jgi:hypothetical protein
MLLKGINHWIKKMPYEVVQINTRKPITRILVVLLLLLAVTWSYFVIRWYMGNTLAEYFNTTENNLQLAEIASSLAPADPLTHWRLGLVSQRRLPMDEQAKAVAEFEKAVSLSPNDYRFWMALGSAQEQSGNPEKGEQAFRRSITLAPSYAYPHWHLGNLLLRQARYDEAFTQLRTASEADPELRPQLFNLIWSVYGSDREAMRNALGPLAEPRAQFAIFLLGQKKIDEGLFIWNTLSSDEKKHSNAGDSIVTALVQELRFHDAMQVWNDIAPVSELRAEVDKIFDGSFETNVTYGTNAVFAWQVQGAPQLQIGIDRTKGHSGSRSLRIVFQVRTKLDAINASQLVATSSDKQYDFECYVRTDKLESGATPRIQIVDAADNSVLATSDQSPNESTDWNRIGLSFKTGPKTTAIRVKVVRDACEGEDNTICPIFGGIWYDDFSIKRRD